MTIETNVVPLRVVDGGVEMIDQRLLPLEETWHRYESAEGVASAIRDMVIRGAPAIGIAAAVMAFPATASPDRQDLR